MKQPPKSLLPTCHDCGKKDPSCFPLVVDDTLFFWLCPSCLYRSEHPNATEESLLPEQPNPRHRKVPVQKEVLFEGGK